MPMISPPATRYPFLPSPVRSLPVLSSPAPSRGLRVRNHASHGLESLAEKGQSPCTTNGTQRRRGSDLLAEKYLHRVRYEDENGVLNPIEPSVDGARTFRLALVSGGLPIWRIDYHEKEVST